MSQHICPIAAAPAVRTVSKPAGSSRQAGYVLLNHEEQALKLKNLLLTFAHVCPL
jgi:hypothetical protein